MNVARKANSGKKTNQHYDKIRDFYDRRGFKDMGIWALPELETVQMAHQETGLKTIITPHLLFFTSLPLCGSEEQQANWGTICL